MSREGGCREPGCSRSIKARGYCGAHYQSHRKYGTLDLLDPPWTPIVAAEPQLIVFGSSLMPPRFWDQIEVTPEGCWRWTGAKNNGYGIININRRSKTLHLITYEVFIGPRPEGMQADHLCHTNDPTCWYSPNCLHRSCCNPLCLEMVPPGENARRGHIWQHKRSHCPQGHPYSPENVYRDKEGYVDCAVCRRYRWRRRYYLKQGFSPQLAEALAAKTDQRVFRYGKRVS